MYCYVYVSLCWTVCSTFEEILPFEVPDRLAVLVELEHMVLDLRR